MALTLPLSFHIESDRRQSPKRFGPRAPVFGCQGALACQRMAGPRVWLLQMRTLQGMPRGRERAGYKGHFMSTGIVSIMFRYLEARISIWLEGRILKI